VLAAVAFAALRHHPDSVVWIPLALALLFLSRSAAMAVWAIGGLEQALYGALLAIAIAAMYEVLAWPTRRARLMLSIALGLACLTRPDGPLFAAAAAVALLAARRFRRPALVEALTV